MRAEPTMDNNVMRKPSRKLFSSKFPIFCTENYRKTMINTEQKAPLSI